MTHTHSIIDIFGIKDPHIQIEDRIDYLKQKHQTDILLFGKLSYQPKCCAHCSVVNLSHKDMIKNGHSYIPKNS